MERERVEREQEELLTRRFTTNNEYDSNANSENIVIDLKHDDFSKDALKSLNKSTILTMNKIRNQRPLVKRVRTRYLNFSADFLGFTKLVFKYSCVDFLILFACSMIILLVIFCFIIWQTSTTRQFNWNAQLLVNVFFISLSLSLSLNVIIGLFSRLYSYSYALNLY